MATINKIGTSPAESNRAELRFIEEPAMGKQIDTAGDNKFSTPKPDAATKYVAANLEDVITARMKRIRYTGHGLNAKIQTTPSTEIRADRQTSALVQTQGSTDGNINFEFSAGEYDSLIEGTLYSSWSVLDISASASGLKRAGKPSVTPVPSTTASISPVANLANTRIFTATNTLRTSISVANAAIAKVIPGNRVLFNSTTQPVLNGSYLVLSVSYFTGEGDTDFIKEAYIPAGPSTTPTTGNVIVELAAIDGVDRSSVLNGGTTASTIGNETITFPSYIRNGVTPRSYTIETEYKSTTPKTVISHRGMRVSSMALNIAVGAIMTGNFNFKGTETSAGELLIPSGFIDASGSIVGYTIAQDAARDLSTEQYFLQFGTDPVFGEFVDIAPAAGSCREIPRLGTGQTVFFAADNTKFKTRTPGASCQAAPIEATALLASDATTSNPKNILALEVVKVNSTPVTVTRGVGDVVAGTRYYISLNYDGRYGNKTLSRRIALPANFGALEKDNDLEANFLTVVNGGTEAVTTFIYAAPGISSDTSAVIGSVLNQPFNGVTNFGQLLIDYVPMNKYTCIKKLDLTIDNTLRELQCLGNLYATGIAAGSVKVTTNFEAYFTNLEMYNRYINDVYSGISFYIKDNNADGGVGCTYYFDIPKIKFSSATVAPGAKDQDVMIPCNGEAVIAYESNLGKSFTVQISRF